ncbi:MAG TPA: glycosyltransferase family 2 protein [Roseiflexaceae bacterium]|nr:glycosyltransferase family 2 protein [Roseiflexaceae bacterium]
MPALAIITVSWNTRDLLHRSIKSVHASLAGSDIDYTIVVVDNGSSDGTPAMLRAEHPEVVLLESGRNLGFAGGNNLALRRVVTGWGLGESSLAPNTQYPTPDYVFLLNPDTEVVGDAIPTLVRYLAAHPDVALAGPQLRYPDGSVQSSRRRFPARGVYFWESTPLEQRWPNNPWARRYRLADAPDDAEQEVDWLVGAALMVRREAIERAGLLDAGFVMYSEELEWQRRIRGMGVGGWGVGGGSQSASPNSYAQRIMYVPQAVIIHHEGKSSEQALARRYINFQGGRLRDARMAYGERFAATVRLFLRAAYAAELAIESLKWLLGHKRALRAQRVSVYWQVLREL